MLPKPHLSAAVHDFTGTATHTSGRTSGSLLFQYFLFLREGVWFCCLVFGRCFHFSWLWLSLFLTVAPYVVFTSECFPDKWLCCNQSCKSGLGGTLILTSSNLDGCSQRSTSDFWSTFPHESKTVLAWWLSEHVPQPYSYPQDFSFEGMFVTYMVYLVFFHLHWRLLDGWFRKLW